MTGRRELRGDPLGHVDRRVERHGPEERKRVGSVVGGVQRQRRVVLGEAALVGEAGLFLLDVGGVG